MYGRLKKIKLLNIKINIFHILLIHVGIPNIKFKKWLLNYTGGNAITVKLQQFKEFFYPKI